MTGTEYRVMRYDGAVRFLPYSIRERARTLGRASRELAEEFRLRAGYPPSVLIGDTEVSLGGDKVSKRELDSLVELASDASAHSVKDQISAGYITCQGGYRIGLCGSSAVSDGKMVGFSSLTSAVIRISREVKGVSDQVFAAIDSKGGFDSTLIVSPPSAGKTTLLRDMVRTLSGDRYKLRVSLADERGEIAATSAGAAQMDVGARTDIIDGCPKAKAVMMLLRAMNPEVIALDEITAPEDIEAITVAANCGVHLLATAHARNQDDIIRRPMYKELIDRGIFRYAVFIRKNGSHRSYDVAEVRQ